MHEGPRRGSGAGRVQGGTRHVSDARRRRRRPGAGARVGLVASVFSQCAGFALLGSLSAWRRLRAVTQTLFFGCPAPCGLLYTGSFCSHCGSDDDVRPAEAVSLINVRPFLYTSY